MKHAPRDTSQSLQTGRFHQEMRSLEIDGDAAGLVRDVPGNFVVVFALPVCASKGYGVVTLGVVKTEVVDEVEAVGLVAKVYACFLVEAVRETGIEVGCECDVNEEDIEQPCEL